LKRSSWTELLLLPVGICGLTPCWLALWLHWLLAAGNRSSAPAVSPLAMLATLVFGTFVTRWSLSTTRNNLQLQQPQRAIGLGGLAAVTGLLWLTFGAHFPMDYLRQFTAWGQWLSPEALALGAGVLCWWQAIRIGRDDDLHSTARREFSLGVTALAILFIVNKVNPQFNTAEAFWPTILFFVLGLSALALAGFEQDRRIQSAAGGPGLGVNQGWLGTVGALIGAIIAGAVALSALVSPETFTSLDRLLDLVGTILIQAVGFLVYWAAVALLPLGQALAQVLLLLLRRIAGLSMNLGLSLNIPSPEQINAAARQLAQTPPFRLLEIAVVFGVILLVFAGAVRRFRRLGGNDDLEEVHENILSSELVWRQLKSLWTRQAAPPADLPDFLTLADSADPRQAVRRVYQQLLEWAASGGLARRPRQTPYSFANTLGIDIPEAQAAIEQLTEIYVRARYGGPITAADVGQAEAAARRVFESTGPAQPA
jgi:hypothetical protein